MQVTNPETNHPKVRLRREMRAILRQSTADSRPITTALGQWLDAHPHALTIAVFSALPGEPDLAEVVANHPDRCWVFPRVVGESLVFHRVSDPASDLTPGTLGILEPTPTLPTVEPAGIDAFFCPGLAFDPRGGRLGRGKGFYDRMLATARPEALKIGICFPYQWVADTYGEAHDIRMDEVIRGS